MLKISLLTEPDHTRWEQLTRAFHTHFGNDHDDAAYARTWQRILDGAPTRGIAAWLNGEMVGIAHYVFHASVWHTRGRCYLADLFVDPTVRRQGIATAILEWVASDADEHGFPGLYWNTLEDAPACALYDKLAKHNQGLIVYTYRRDRARSDS
ncbi:GNAT family N-acetyltransferase [Actinokineospora enzanensis]|uniref:GNAT family N-acetyltransferase n=1 Tax=Actinokineospora enzanensis TaxID=155975 RepID=UPI000524C8CF|nr:GNAT family N-acetyltransferase [Actinokineospora enzanensis]